MIDTKIKPTPTRVRKVHWKNKWRYHHTGKYRNVLTGQMVFRYRGQVRLAGKHPSAEIAEQKALEFLRQFKGDGRVPEYLGPVKFEEE